MKRMTFVVAMKDYFGFKAGQKLGEFAQELTELSPDEKAWFGEQLPLVGYELTGNTYVHGL
jgi:hypothetical protein